MRGPLLALCLLLRTTASAEPSILDIDRLSGGPAAVLEPTPAPGPTHEDAFALVLKDLAGSKVPDDYVKAAFDDPETRLLPEISDSFKKPAEALPYEKYRKIFITEAKISLGAGFYADHKDQLETVSGRFAVEPLVLVSLLGVETHYGAGPGKISVFNALYTVVRRIPRRSAWAAKELAEFLKLCRREGFGPHAVLGSYAGAFGYYQFMPSSYNAYAVDLDGDGKSAYDQWPDVLATMANFLKAHGAGPGDDYSPGSKNSRAIHSYNPSDNYVRAVVELRDAIKTRLRPAVLLTSDPAARARMAAQAARAASLGGVFGAQ